MTDIFDAEHFWYDFCLEAKDNASDYLNKNNISFFNDIDSTNSYLMRLLSKCGRLWNADGSFTRDGSALENCLVAAESQSAGRGRLGRKFYSPSKTGIYFSFAEISAEGITDPALYTIAAVVGVCRAVERLYGISVAVKWVNDIYIGSKKICGILTEGFANAETGRVEVCVVGIGINIKPSEVFPEDLSQKAGGILCENDDSKGISRTRLMAACMYEIKKALNDFENTVAFYKSRSFLIGKTITVTPLIGDNLSKYNAVAVDVTEDAGLVVKTDDGRQTVLYSGEVSLHETCI